MPTESQGSENVPTVGGAGEQPMPKAGRMDVTPTARCLFADMLTERERRGVETYGTTLQTFNGRNAVVDALEEIIDAWQYVVQIGLENDALVRDLADARAEIERLKQPKKRAARSEESRQHQGAVRLGIDPAEYRAKREAGLRWCSGHQGWESAELFGRNANRADGIAVDCREASRDRVEAYQRRRRAS